MRHKFRITIKLATTISESGIFFIEQVLAFTYGPSDSHEQSFDFKCFEFIARVIRSSFYMFIVMYELCN